MTNLEIAKQISDIGDMLEILNDPQDQFRIIAYHNAARKIEMMSEEIENIYKQRGRKGLQEISGIGESISQHIEEYIKTKGLKYHNELAKKVPGAILEFTKIPGIGPKGALKLYQAYGVNKINDLKKAIKKDRTEKFFKIKSKQNVLEGIEQFKGLTGRMLLSFAEPIAREVVETLKTYPEIIKADMVGSLRRMEETIGDIDVVAASKNPRQTIEKYIKEPFVKHCVAHGTTKAEIIHTKGPQIDLEILPKDQYGSLLQHLTGSKEHNIALRTWAEKHGFSISEHGIKKVEIGKTMAIKCETEEKVYKILGMQMPIPEMRENRGEISLALKNKLPEDIIELKDIRADLHLHSAWSEGELTIEKMARACKDLGYDYLAITDHTSGLGITHGLRAKEFSQYADEIKQISDKLKINILAGAEANIMADGSLDIPDKFLGRLDFVIGAVHGGFRQNQEQATKRLIRAMENPNIDAIGHPSGRLIERRSALNIDWEKAFEAARRTNKIMEINAQPDRLDLNDSLILLAKQYGLRFIISTDAHHIRHLDNMRYGVATARRGWLEKKDVLNTLPLAQFLKGLKR